MASLRYLSAADVTACLPPAAEVVDLVEAALRGSARPPVKVEVSRTQDGFLQAQPGLAVLFDDDQPAGFLETGSSPPLHEAVTAAAAAVAARQLADPGSEVITILGCGSQGRANIRALLAVFPHTEHMLCFDADVARQEAFADEIMTTFNLASIIPPEPYEAVVGAHILVSATTLPAKPAPVIEPAWLQTGTLAIAQDLDAIFRTETLNAADRLLVDEPVRFEAACAKGHFAGLRPPDGDLASVVAGRAPGRGTGKPTIICVHVGIPALELALAAVVLRRADAAGRGTALPS